MGSKIQVTIDVIVHATEDVPKILESFEILDIRKEDFRVSKTQGHFENPIVILSVNIEKREAQRLIHRITELLPAQQVADLVGQIEERTVNSRLHMRLDKQELVNGILTIREGGAIKLKIFAPIYHKRDTVKIFTEILQTAN